MFFQPTHKWSPWQSTPTLLQICLDINTLNHKKATSWTCLKRLEWASARTNLLICTPLLFMSLSLHWLNSSLTLVGSRLLKLYSILGEMMMKTFKSTISLTETFRFGIKICSFFWHVSNQFYCYSQYLTKSRLHAYTVCAFDICLYLTPLGQARQFTETCGT